MNNNFYNYARAFFLGVFIMLTIVWINTGFNKLTATQNVLLLTGAGFSWGFFTSGFFNKKK